MSIPIKKIPYNNLLLSVALLFCMNISYSQETNKINLNRLPPAPPYQKAEVTLDTAVMDGCMLFDKVLVGYIISNEKDNGHDYSLVQDKKGDRYRCYIDKSSLSNTVKGRLKSILIPGMKVEIKFQVCGSGGFIYVMKIKNLTRRK